MRYPRALSGMVDCLIVVALLQTMVWDDDRYGLRALAAILIIAGLMLHPSRPAGRREGAVAFAHLLGLLFIALVSWRTFSSPLALLLIIPVVALLGSTLGMYALRPQLPSASLVALCAVAFAGLLVRQSEHAHLVVSGLEELQSGPDAVLIEPWLLLVAVLGVRAIAPWCLSGTSISRQRHLSLHQLWTLLLFLGGSFGLWQLASLASPFPAVQLRGLASAEGAFTILCCFWVLRSVEPPGRSACDTPTKDRHVVWFGQGKRVLGLALLGTCLMGATLYGLSSELRARCIPDENEPHQIPFVFVNYLLSAEDPIFFQHRGVDYSRMSAAVREAVGKGVLGRGGSTISMQLAKLCVTGAEMSVSRKMVQIVAAVLLELTTQKAQILRAYLETIPMGAGIKGLSQASEAYFVRPPGALSDAQSLQLVQTIYDPEGYNPALVQNKVIRQRAAAIRGRARGSCRWLANHLQGANFVMPGSNSCS